MVIGLAYIFFFNPTSWNVFGWTVPNPFAFLYGTMAILVLSNIVHFYTVSFMTGTTALKQIDPEFEAVSASLRVPFYRTFACVTLPLVPGRGVRDRHVFICECHGDGLGGHLPVFAGISSWLRLPLSTWTMPAIRRRRQPCRC